MLLNLTLLYYIIIIRVRLLNHWMFQQTVLAIHFFAQLYTMYSTARIIFFNWHTFSKKIVRQIFVQNIVFFVYYQTSGFHDDLPVLRVGLIDKQLPWRVFKIFSSRNNYPHTYIVYIYLFKYYALKLCSIIDSRRSRTSHWNHLLLLAPKYAYNIIGRS